MLQINRIDVKGIRNARDLSQLKCQNGRKIKEKKLIRSSQLNTTKAKHFNNFLKEYNVKLIIDLRSQIEVNEGKPIVYPSTVDYINIPVLNQEFWGITHEKSMSKILYNNRHLISKDFSGNDYMINMYRSIVFDEGSQNRFKTFFNILLDKKIDGAILYHCHGGKDRTGIATLYILTLLGVSENAILDDYASSDVFNKWYNIKRRIGLKLLFFISPKFRKLLTSMLYAKREYLESTINSIKKEYGSVREFLRVKIDIDDLKQQKLIELFTE